MAAIPKRFLQDPDWFQVEEMVLEFINPLRDVLTIDVTAPAEMVKAEVMSRQKSYEALINLTRSSGLIREGKDLNKVNIFK